MQDRERILLLFFAMFLAAFTCLMLSRCAPAQANNPTAMDFAGPNGKTCYVIFYGGSPVGGNCN